MSIPVLMETLCIEGNIIAFDTMETQTDIANNIIENIEYNNLAVKEKHGIAGKLFKTVWDGDYLLQILNKMLNKIKKNKILINF